MDVIAVARAHIRSASWDKHYPRPEFISLVSLGRGEVEGTVWSPIVAAPTERTEL